MENNVFESTDKWVFLTSDIKICTALKNNDNADCVMLFYDFLSEAKELNNKNTVVLVANKKDILKSMHLMFFDLFPEFVGDVFFYHFRQYGRVVPTGAMCFF